MKIGAATLRPVSLFYSYSHRDEEFRSALETHLSVLRRNRLVAEWHDRMIGAGGDWRGEIDRNLASADIVLLLVSADFIASDYCWGEEMTKALQRHERGEARVIPVILRPCRWRSTPLAKLQAVPRNGKPVTDWLSRDAAFDDVAAAIAHHRGSTARPSPGRGRRTTASRGGADAKGGRRTPTSRSEGGAEAEEQRRKSEAENGEKRRKRGNGRGLKLGGWRGRW